MGESEPAKTEEKKEETKPEEKPKEEPKEELCKCKSGKPSKECCCKPAAPAEGAAPAQ